MRDRGKALIERMDELKNRELSVSDKIDAVGQAKRWVTVAYRVGLVSTLLTVLAFVFGMGSPGGRRDVVPTAAADFMIALPMIALLLQTAFQLKLHTILRGAGLTPIELS